MRRLLGVVALLTGFSMLTASVAVGQEESAAPAQEPAPYKKLCEVFGPAAVSEALGGGRVREERAAGSKQACWFAPRGKRNFTELTVTVNELDEETYVYGDQTADSMYGLLLLNYPEAIETEVAGLPALRQPTQRLVREARGWRFGQLYVVPDRTRWMTLSARGPRGVDVDEALRQLAELAIPRVFGSAAAPEPSASPGALASPEASASPSPSAAPESSASPEAA